MWKVLKYGRYVAEVVRKDFYGHRWSLEISRKRLSACVSSPKVSPPKEERVFHSWVRRHNADDEQTEMDDVSENLSPFPLQLLFQHPSLR